MMESADQSHHHDLDAALAIPQTNAANATTRILFALPSTDTRRKWAHRFASRELIETTCVDTYDAACAALARDGACVVLIDPSFDQNRGMKLARHIHRCRSRAKMILLSEKSSFELAVDAMRLGVVDVLSIPVSDEDLRYSVDSAVVRIRDEQRQLDRITRLREMCRSLSTAKQETTRQVELLCRDLASAYEDITDQINEAAMVSEFRTLLAQELDLEALLRTTLEYMLTKTGPTNAAVFLPDGDGGFELGAYVNYDCPREDAEVLLEHLCHIACPVLEHERDVIRCDDAKEFADWVGEETACLHDAQITAFTCREESEPLAIMVLFRDVSKPFDERLEDTLDALRTIFAKQVASVIRVHHRARPEWPVEPAEDGWDVDDEFGFAA